MRHELGQESPATNSKAVTRRGNFPRDKGVLPWKYYLDANVQRAFTLTRNRRAEHQQVLTINLRSSNVLNHANITQVGGVLGRRCLVYRMKRTTVAESNSVYAIASSFDFHGRLSP